VHAALFRDDPALLLRSLALVTLDHVDPAYERTVLIGTHLYHFARSAFVTARENHDLVALADLGGHHSTSGASEMIFM
jgi:hypothetical protein